MKKVFEKKFHGRTLIVETGEIAKQASGSVLVRFGDTAVLTAVVGSKKASNSDFFPLMVLYQEKMYSVGKIPGGFIKREGRPTENSTLTARVIDRPMRPMFPEGFKNEVQVVNTILSVDQDNTPEMTAMFGSSLATCISDIPFNGPIAGVVVGRINGKYIINPTVAELEESDIDLTVAGTKDAINMVEAGAKEVSEKEMLEAIMVGHDAIKELVKFQEKITKAVGKEKFKYEIPTLDKKVKVEMEEAYSEKLKKVVSIEEKIERYTAKDLLKEEVVADFDARKSNNDDDTKIYDMSLVKDYYERMFKNEVRRLITEDKVRPDGRKIDEIRQLDSQVDILARTHGSALFTRGQTQVLSVTTLGAMGEHQILDGLGVEDQKRFIHHYNFPQFSVGETGRYGSPGRREVGHGALGERALAQVIPTEEEFPYTIRVVSEVLESNGSSSQASICAGCMSLMAAGVPIKSPVAGIAMGLVSDGKNYTILTDIQGLEDHEGDMDFKVAGTKDGICALQMDIKISGITKGILTEALDQAKEARMEILDNMTGAIKEARSEMSKYAPKLMQMKIKPEQIKMVIGKGGETIDKIIEEAGGVKIDIEEDGRVVIYHTDIDKINVAMEMIKNLTKEVETGKIYTVKVVKVEAFGAFVELWKGTEGLVHISQLDSKRTEKTSDVVSVGDEILVKSLGYDNKGRLNLSRKEALEQK